MITIRRPGLAGSLLLCLGLVLGACSGAAAPAPASPSPSASASPGGAGDDTGVVPPDSPIVGAPPVGGGGEPPDGGLPTLVIAQPGTINPQPVSISELIAQVDGRHVVLNARWYSGVEPCYVLDRIDVAHEGSTFTITLFEGATQADAVCIEIAMYKAAVIDLGELDPGTYVVKASHGDAAAITVVVE
jgi:hypothetical protein